MHEHAANIKRTLEIKKASVSWSTSHLFRGLEFDKEQNMFICIYIYTMNITVWKWSSLVLKISDLEAGSLLQNKLCNLIVIIEMQTIYNSVMASLLIMKLTIKKQKSISLTWAIKWLIKCEHTGADQCRQSEIKA